MLMPLDRTDTTGLLAFPMSNALIPLILKMSFEQLLALQRNLQRKQCPSVGFVFILKSIQVREFILNSFDWKLRVQIHITAAATYPRQRMLVKDPLCGGEKLLCGAPFILVLGLH